MNIDIITHYISISQASHSDYIANLMRARVKQGCPEEVTVIIDEQVQTAFGWTDGIDSILSVFIPIDKETIKEILFVEKSHVPLL